MLPFTNMCPGEGLRLHSGGGPMVPAFLDLSQHNSASAEVRTPTYIFNVSFKGATEDVFPILLRKL